MIKIEALLDEADRHPREQEYMDNDHVSIGSILNGSMVEINLNRKYPLQ